MNSEIERVELSDLDMAHLLDPDLLEPVVRPSEAPPECEMLLVCWAATLAFGFRLRVWMPSFFIESGRFTWRRTRC